MLRSSTRFGTPDTSKMPNPPGPKACPTKSPRNTSHQTHMNGHSGKKAPSKAKEPRSTCSILACTSGVSRPKSARLRATTSATAAHIARPPHIARLRPAARTLASARGYSSSSSPGWPPPPRPGGRPAAPLGPAGQGRREVAGRPGQRAGAAGVAVGRGVVNFLGRSEAGAGGEEELC